MPFGFFRKVPARFCSKIDVKNLDVEIKERTSMPNEDFSEVNGTPDFFDVQEAEWHARFPDKNIRCNGTVTRLVRLAQHSRRRTERIFERYGLSIGEGEVLSAVVRSPDHRLQPKHLHERMIISSGGLTARIDSLEKKGALVREPDARDRRAWILQATPAGVALAIEVHAAHVRDEERFIEALDSEESVVLERLLKKLVLSVEPEEGDPGAGDL